MLSNAYFLAKFRFDTAENEPAKNPQAKKTYLQKKETRAGGWALKPKWLTPLPPRVSWKRSGLRICSEADGNSSRLPETLSIELPFQHSRNCQSFSGALTFRCCLNSSRKGTGVCNRPSEEHLKAKRPNRISQIFLMHFSTD